MQVILNTWYGGEKGMFSYMNYLLPLKGMASMHCSANTNAKGETAIFFGLSGTGKTRFSTDPKRHDRRRRARLDDDGIQLEGGWQGAPRSSTCRRTTSGTPSAAIATRCWRTTVDKGKIDYADKSVIKNIRVSYPIFHIENIVNRIESPGCQEGDLSSADAFGAAPVSIPNHAEQTKYYFPVGFHRQIRWVRARYHRADPTFSVAGAAFLSLHPTKYGEEL